MNVKHQHIFIILPLIYVFLSFIVLHYLVGFYITMPDPVYIYLMNGTNLASGHWSGYADHPGTPVQCFAAIVIFIKYLLTGTPTLPLYQDVLLHPESYLYVCSTMLVVLVGSVTYLTAAYVYRNTGSIATALFFQLTPVTAGLYDTSMIRPEAFIIITITFFGAYLYVNVLAHERSTEKSWSTKQIITMGMVSAFLISCKITCSPLIFPVLFMLKEKKWKILYLLTVVCSFFIFIIPALPMLGYMYHWVIGLITHDGHYGHGNERIINTQEFVKNIHEILTSSFVFTSLFIIITTSFIWTIIKRKNYISPCPRLIAGIWIAISLLILMVAKHYSFYYLIPVLAFLPLGAMVSYHLLREPLYLLNKKVVKYILPAAFAFVLIYQAIDNAYSAEKYKNPLLETQKFISTYKKLPVVMACVYDAPFIEPSIEFGIVYSGNLRHQYHQFANEKYSNSYFYNIDEKRLFKWNINVMPEEILKKHNEILFYFKNESEQSEKNILDDLFSGVLSDSKKIYINPESRESLYLLTADTAKIKNMLVCTYRVSSDLEKVTEDKLQFLSSDPHITLAGASRLSTEEHFSGNNSIKLNWTNQYGLDMAFEVHPGDFIDVTVWRKAGSKQGAIVLQSANFYAGGEAVIQTGENGWEQIQCRSKIPAGFADKSIKCYLYYTGSTDAYFDDIQVNIYAKKDNQ